MEMSLDLSILSSPLFQGTLLEFNMEPIYLFKPFFFGSICEISRVSEELGDFFQARLQKRRSHEKKNTITLPETSIATENG